VFSGEALAKLLATIGALYMLMELMDFLAIYAKDRYSKYAIFPILVFSLLYVVISRRPVSRVVYKIPTKDYSFEVKIGDLFSESGDLVISTSTTFDTDIATGLIAPDSLQGQLALRFFRGNTAEIDRQLNQALEGIESVESEGSPGKIRAYPIGTVAKVVAADHIFYLVAMSRLNSHGTASSSLRDIEDALTGLWKFIADRGELAALVIPLMGTGRGRVELPRKKMVERIAQSFADASRDKIFSNRLTIIVRPVDAENFQINLFEVRDYLSRSLHA
jgi:hypothetical protein